MNTPSKRREPPSNEAIALLPLFDRLQLPQISCVQTGEQAKLAAQTLLRNTLWGFDTESKPTFRAGEVSTGPHVLQLAIRDHAWVFQLQDQACRAIASQLLATPGIIKAGFGLRDDQKRIRAKLGVEPQGVVEINQLFREMGYRKEIGVKAAVASLLGQRFIKSKKISTSNWAAATLSQQQLVYAANDAYAACCVYAHLPLANP